MKIALLTTDNREHWGKYELAKPVFGTAPEALLQGFAAIGSDIEIHVICCTRKPFEHPPKLSDNIYYHSILIPSWGMMKSLYWGAVRAIRKKLIHIQPDIVHGQGTERDCALSAVFSGFPNVLTIHGNMREIAKLDHSRVGSFYWIAGKLERLALARAGGVFCNSDYTQSLIKPYVFKTWKVPNAIRSNYFLSIPSHKKNLPYRFVNIGVISKRKRQVEVLHEFAKLHHAGVPVKIDFIGACDENTAYGDRFLNGIKKAELCGYARYLGTRDSGGLIGELDDADAMVHFPSEEAFGLVAAEGLARGLKFFSAKVGGLPDICQDMSGVELYDKNDWEGLFNGIRHWALKGMETDARFAENQNIIYSRYHPQVIAQRHLEIYQEVLNQK